MTTGIDHERILNEVTAGKSATSSLANSVDQLRKEIGTTRSEIASLGAKIDLIQEDIAPHKELYEDFRAVGRVGRAIRNIMVVLAGTVTGAVVTWQAIVHWFHPPPPGT